jgi:rubrerythrin
LKAIRVAIEFEGKGAEYYANLRDQVTDPKEKAFFNLLANIEHEHYVSLKDTEQYMIDPATWFREKEEGGLDGA